MEPHILIAIPHRERVHPYFLPAYTQLLVGTINAGIKFGLHHGFGGDIGRVRNDAVKAFLHGDYTHLFFLDDDTLPKPNAIPQLLKRKLPIVSGLYPRRNEPHYPIILRWPDKRNKTPLAAFPYKMSPPKNALVECDAVGAGCLLIKREVFTTIEPPWFRLLPKAGEDIYFCARAKHAGFKIYVDTGVECLHIVEHTAGSSALLKEWGKRIGFEVDYDVGH